MAAGAIDGKTSAQITAIATSTVPPEWYVISSLLGVWVGFVGGPWVASLTAGTRSFLRDMRVRFRPIDLPLGIAIGLLGQWIISLLYSPFQHDITNYNAPTTKLAGSTHGNGGIFLIVVATALLAPLAEELFFRGLLFRGLLRLCSPGPTASARLRQFGVASAVVLDGLLFGLSHGEWVQLAGLALFGMVLAVVTLRTGRLGMNMVAHGAFNMAAVLVYLKVV